MRGPRLEKRDRKQPASLTSAPFLLIDAQVIWKIDIRYGYWDSLPAQKPTVAAGGGICPRAPVEGGRRQDVVFKKILSCLTKFDEERANKLMMS